MGQYKDRLENLRGNISLEEIRKAKVARCKARNELYREERRKEAEERQAARVKRGDKEQLRLLDLRFGKDLGAKKERARLTAKLA